MIKNLTPHVINIVEPGYDIKSFPSIGVARLFVQYKFTGQVLGIPVKSASFGEIEGLPEYDGKSMYITSAMVAEAAWRLGRHDVYSPGQLVRDDAGVIVGCECLLANPNGGFVNE